MKEFVRDIVIAIAIVVIVSLVIKPTIVKEHSMEDTLQNNDYVVLYKLAYLTKEHPDHGDIIVFKSSMKTEDGKTKLLIKRVIGVEGDTISIHDGNVYRNGQLLKETYVKDGYTDGEVSNLVVPENELYVMGDNRSVSVDSRSSDVGLVSEDAVVGKAIIRLFPFNKIKLL